MLRFRWPVLPDGKDWRIKYISRLTHMQTRERQRELVSAAYNSPHILPQQLNEIAEQFIKEKELERNTESKELQRVKGEFFIPCSLHQT